MKKDKAPPKPKKVDPLIREFDDALTKIDQMLRIKNLECYSVLNDVNIQLNLVRDSIDHHLDDLCFENRELQNEVDRLSRLLDLKEI